MDIEKFIDGHKEKIISGLKKLKSALATESLETKEMLEIYAQYTLGKATAEDIEKADKQLQDILKTLGLGVFTVLPFAPITIPVCIKRFIPILHYRELISY